MVKTKVQDLAEEFGVAPDQLLTLLRDMGVTARSASATLEDSQVSAVRVRWEREKRRQAEPAAAKKPARRKDAAKAAEPPPPAEEQAKPVRRRRTAAEVAEAQAEADAAARLAAEETLSLEGEKT